MLTALGKSIPALLALLAAGPAFAKQLSGPDVGVTPFGMGRAYSAIADDWLALHYNPAGLAMVSRVDFQVFDLKLESNYDVINSRSLLTGMGSNSSDSLAGSVGKFANKHIMADASNVTQLTVPHFAMGVVYNNSLDFDLENLSYPVTRMSYFRDLTLLAGGAVGFGKRKDLRLGTTVKFISRTGADRTIPISEIMGSKSTLKSMFNQHGTGIGADFGMQYRLPTPGRVEYTTSFVWHDIGQTRFGDVQAANPPTPLAQNMVAGMAIRFPIGGMKNRRLERRYGPTRSSSSFSLVFDYDHLNKSLSDEPFAKHSHLGMNLDLPIMSFQLGLNQTAITFGSSFDIGIVRIGLATYGEEIGSYAGQRVDRRYLLSIGSDFGFSTAGKPGR